MSQEDIIIAKGLAKVRKGILDGDWQTVCDGYNSISGEELAPQQPRKTRLESIREMLANENDGPPPPPAEEVKPKRGRKPKKIILPSDPEAQDEKEIPLKVDWSKLDNEAVKKRLRSLGVTSHEIGAHDRDQLIKIGMELEKNMSRVGVVVKESSSGIKIITTAPNEKEVKENEALAATRMRITPPKRTGAPRDNSKDPDAGSRYIDKPPHPER